MAQDHDHDSRQSGAATALDDCCGGNLPPLDLPAKKAAAPKAKSVLADCCGADLPPLDLPAKKATPKAASVLDDCCGGGAALPPLDLPRKAVKAEAAGSCCAPAEAAAPVASSHQGHQHHAPRRRDWLMIVSAALVGLGLLIGLLVPSGVLPATVQHFGHGVTEIFGTMWWGLVLGIVAVGLLGRIPRELIMGVLGNDRGLKGILRAVGAGLLLDLCNHGILLVGLRLYERGASLGQTMAFLIASPWNSLSLTIILAAFIGVPWMLAFVVLSAVIAIVSGLIFERLVAQGVLPDNPNRVALADGFDLKREVAARWRGIDWTPQLFLDILRDGWRHSGMILRWLLLGVVLAAVLRSFLTVEDFKQLFGPTLIGLAITLAVTTVLEVCSEGSSPIAADIFNRAGAPGNAFAFLMAGAATDYTEVMGLKERTGSWKIALFLPLVAVPQVVVIAWLLN